jgi:hypothetical protein
MTSVLDRAANRLAGTIAQIRTRHCLYAAYVNRGGKPGKSRFRIKADGVARKKKQNEQK